MERIRQRVLRIGLVIGLLSTSSGCRTRSDYTRGPYAIDGTTQVIKGDWDDVNGAVLLAAMHRAMGIMSQDTPDDLTQTFTLLTAHDETVTLIVKRQQPIDPKIRPSQEGPIEMTIFCKVGLFGDAGREKGLLDDMSFRLAQLEGPFKTAPIPSGWDPWGT